MRGDGFLSPWDSIPFFQPPVMSRVTMDENGVVFAKADPMRVSLIIQCVSAQAVTVGVNSPLAAGSGFALQSSMLPWELKIADHGYLVQLEWRAIVPVATTGVLVVTTVSMAKWPEEPSAQAVTPADIRRSALAYARAREVFAQQNRFRGNTAAER